MKKQTFLCGIFILSIGTILSKVIGAIYRVPLTWMLGVEGLGIYQLVYPMFALLLILSSTGAPTAISAMVSERIKQEKYVEARKIFKLSTLLLFVVSVFFGIILLAFSGVLSNIQGNSLATYPYMAISLAIPLVSILSAYRGYYQGCQNMIPTALTQIIEQLGKLVFGLILGGLLLPMGIEFGVVGAFLGIVIGEVLAVIAILIYSKFINKKSIQHNLSINTTDITPNKPLLKELIKRTTPILLASLILPILQVLDSMLVVNLLVGSGFATSQATILWGIFSGVVTSIINLPIILSLAVSTSIVPEITSAKSIVDSAKIQKAFNLTINLALPSMFGIMILAPNIIAFLYGNTLATGSIDEFAVATNLLVLSSVIVLLTSIMQIQNATLQGLNKSIVPLRNILFCSGLKIILVLLLVTIPSINIYGLLIANVTFYLSVIALNQYFIKKKLLVNNSFGNVLPSFTSCGVMTIILLISNFAFVNLSIYIALPLQVFLGLSTYLSTLLITDKQIKLPSFLKNKLHKVYKR